MGETDPDTTGWTQDWQLLSTPLTRRLDLWVKTTAVASGTLMVAYCALLANLVVDRVHWLAVLLVPALWAVTFAVGPPRLPVWTGVARIGVAAGLHSPLLAALAAAWLCAEAGDQFFMPRLLAAGRGGPLPSMREARRTRVAGLRAIRAARQQRLLRALGVQQDATERAA